MITLNIGNSVCNISGLSIEQHKALREMMSYKLSPQISYYTGGFKSDKRYLLDRKGNFPSGLLYICEEFLKDQEVYSIDNRIAPNPLERVFTCLMPYTLYPEQKAAVEAIAREKRGIICCPTGSGKSLIIVGIIARLKVPTLIVVPTLELKRQLQDTIKSCFGSNKYIRVENIDALDTNKVEKDVGAVIIDEFHHSGAKTYRKLNQKAWINIYYKIGLTATPFRSQDNERLLLESVLSKVVYQLDYKTAVNKNYIVPLEAYYIEVPKWNLKSNGKSWPSVYSELVVNNEQRNKIIAEILVKFHVNKLSTLCLVKEIKHGANLVKLTNAAFVNGFDDETKQYITFFNDKKISILIGTTGVLGEGVDTKPCEYVIIAGLGKSKNQFMQQCGRAFRVYPGKESAKVIIIRDSSHKWTLAHFRAQCKILKDEYGLIPVKLEI